MLLLRCVSTIKHLEKMFVQEFACVVLVVLTSLDSRVVWCQVPCQYMYAEMSKILILEELCRCGLYISAGLTSLLLLIKLIELVTFKPFFVFGWK